MTATQVGLTAYGGYAPRRRLSRQAVTEANAWLAPGLRARGRGTRAMANWDEDSITMAVAACRDLLGPGEDRSWVDALYFASTTQPFADRLNAGVIASALTLDKAVCATDVSASQRAGAGALIQALEAARGGGFKHALVAAADHRRARAAGPRELEFGDAAAALGVGVGDLIARFLGSYSLTVDFVDHFRGAGQVYDYGWEERWIRDEGFAKIVPHAIEGLFEKTGVSGSDIDHFILPCPFPRVPAQLAKRYGIAPEKVRDTLAGTLGDSGAAHGLVMLVHALQEAGPGEKILLLQFGGGCDALLFETTDKLAAQSGRDGITAALANGVEETNYLKFLTFNGLLDWDKGMRAEQDKKTALTTLYRHDDMIMGLVGGRCRETGVVQFPRTRISVNPNQHTVDTQEPYKFAERKAQILSWSADYLSFSMNPPNHYGMMVFAEGGRIMMDITDVEPGQVETGMDMRMVFRIKDVDENRGFTRYFWKAAPA